MNDKVEVEWLRSIESQVRQHREEIESEHPYTVGTLTAYSQRDPRWANLEYAGGTTFAAAGCYVTSVAMICSGAGYLDDPPEVARRLREAGCFDGNLLTRPDKIPDAYPLTVYEGAHNWHSTSANMDSVWGALAKGPTIIEVDFRPTTKTFDQHFVVGESWDEETGDVFILDPWDGQRVRLMERYELVWYSLLGFTPKLENAICGLRLLRPVKFGASAT
jgi:hypothetical protein